MRYLYTYTLMLPLTYYTYDLRSDDSEFILGLDSPVEWDEVQSIEMLYPMDDNKMFTAVEKIHFCLSSHFTQNVSDDGNDSHDMPDKFFQCTVSGIVAESKTKARELVDAFIIRACKSLSILMSCQNCNKQGYQPRVEPDYRRQSWKEEAYQPYEKLVEEACEPKETIDENGRRVIHMFIDHSNVMVEEECYMTIFGKMDAKHFFEFYQYERSPDLSYIMDEYYAALGREALTSKFFHLFSIIEYVEKNFIQLAECKKIFKMEDKQLVREAFKKIDLPKDKRNRLCSFVMSSMGRATDIGREEKLVNILHNMGVSQFRECGTQFAVDRKTIGELIGLRNSFYHGGGKNAEDVKKQIDVETAVARLMYICERIIVYVSRTVN